MDASHRDDDLTALAARIKRVSRRQAGLRLSFALLPYLRTLMAYAVTIIVAKILVHAEPVKLSFVCSLRPSKAMAKSEGQRRATWHSTGEPVAWLSSVTCWRDGRYAGIKVKYL